MDVDAECEAHPMCLLIACHIASVTEEPLRQSIRKMSKPEETGASSVVRALQASGVTVCFANPGTTEMHLVAGLDSVPSMRSVLGLHETVCTGAADAYGRMARVPAATLLHLGPGLANGLANLHNARRARSPVLNIVGDMASWHTCDPPLAMDIQSLARSVSGFVRTSDADPAHAAGDVAQAVAATLVPATALASRVATLIVPHDMTWTMTAAQSTSELEALAAAAKREATSVRGDALSGPQADAFFTACAAVLRASPPGKAAMLLGGAALLTDGDAIHIAGAIAAATGAALLCENGFARVDRGAGIPAVTRIPYFPREAAKAMGQFTTLILCDARLPVPMFGYASGPAEVVALPDDAVWDIDAADTCAALRKLAACLGIPGDKLVPAPAPHSRPPVRERPELRNREAALTPSLLCAVVAAMQPADAIVIDEALTTGTDYWAFSADAPPFSHLTLTGGAIGQGPPAAVGAAVACPSRRVVNIQADGSGLYSVQALWTQARERLSVVTVVCANNKYNILKIEQGIQRTGASGQVARALTDLSDPRIDWVALGRGFGVAHAVRVSTVGALADEFGAALGRAGPTLIEATLP